LDGVLARLQSQKVGMPWMVPTGLTHTTLLNVASWVWAKGGEFISPDGTHTLFNAPAARAGMRAYFMLGRHLTPATRHLSRNQPDQHFLHNPQVAMIMSGPWVFQDARKQWPNRAADLGVALPPGPSFVGGSYLVVWKHSRNVDSALQLIRFLTGVRAQVSYAQAVGLLPVRQAALKESPFAGDPFWQWVVRGVQTGRSLPVTRSWGLVEYRLTAAFTAIWGAVLAEPTRDPGSILDEHLRPLAQRLDPVLSGR
jgi:multiple sugar transport system substrate-binding protein